MVPLAVSGVTRLPRLSRHFFGGEKERSHGHGKGKGTNEHLLSLGKNGNNKTTLEKGKSTRDDEKSCVLDGQTTRCFAVSWKKKKDPTLCWAGFCGGVAGKAPTTTNVFETFETACAQIQKVQIGSQHSAHTHVNMSRKHDNLHCSTGFEQFPCMLVKICEFRQTRHTHKDFEFKFQNV